MSPGIIPMLHAVIALAEIDERTGLGNTLKRTQLLPVSNYGDVRNVRLPDRAKPIPVPLDQHLICSYLIPNSELQSPFSRILERWVEPAARELADVIKKLDGDYRCFARLALPPEDMGVMAFRADHNDLSVMCSMAYDMKEESVRCQLGLLCGWFNSLVELQ